MRRQRAAETRDRIVAAGAELLHGFPVWNWRALTVRRVAERAGVNERTVYRHFASERELRDAVLARLEEEAGVDLEGLALEDVPTFTARGPRVRVVVPARARARRATTDARRRAPAPARRAARRGDRRPPRRWPAADRAIAAAMLDVLWSVVSYERLVADWELDPKARRSAASPGSSGSSRTRSATTGRPGS